MSIVENAQRGLGAGLFLLIGKLLRRFCSWWELLATFGGSCFRSKLLKPMGTRRNDSPSHPIHESKVMAMLNPQNQQVYSRKLVIPPQQLSPGALLPELALHRIAAPSRVASRYHEERFG